MLHSFTIPKRGFEGLQVLVGLGSAQMQKLAATVKDRALSLNLSGLAKEVAKELQFSSPDDLELAFSAVLMPLSELRLEFGLSAEDFVDLLGKRIAEQEPAWFTEQKKAWAAITPSLRSLVGQDSYFGLLQKAFRLVNVRALMATDIKILTELRPVYDDNVTKARAMLLTSTLVIEYEDGDSTRTIHLTLGQRGLQTLRSQVNRADKKTSVLEEWQSKSDVPLLVAGTEWAD